MLRLGFRFRRDVLRTAAIGEGKALAHEKGADIDAARRADGEFARVPVDEVVIDMTGEIGRSHELAQSRRGDLAARPGRAVGIATTLLGLEGIDAVKPEPLAPIRKRTPALPAPP